MYVCVCVCVYVCMVGTGPGFRITAVMFQYPTLHICIVYICGEIKNLELGQSGLLHILESTTLVLKKVNMG